jgi:hypothetical protein
VNWAPAVYSSGTHPPDLLIAAGFHTRWLPPATAACKWKLFCTADGSRRHPASGVDALRNAVHLNALSMRKGASVQR